MFVYKFVAQYCPPTFPTFRATNTVVMYNNPLYEYINEAKHLHYTNTLVEK